jgi:hypothetical protein
VVGDRMRCGLPDCLCCWHYSMSFTFLQVPIQCAF